MKRRRRHRPAGSNRPKATSAFVIAGISLLSTAACAAGISMSIMTKGNTNNWLGGMGVLFILADVICLIAGTRIFKNTNYTTLSRVLGLVAPLVPLTLWLFLYLVGMLYG